MKLRRPQQRAGQEGVGAYLGRAIRHCRRAVDLNLREGPTADVAESARQASAELDSVVWVCDYAATEGEP